MKSTNATNNASSGGGATTASPQKKGPQQAPPVGSKEPSAKLPPVGPRDKQPNPAASKTSPSSSVAAKTVAPSQQVSGSPSQARSKKSPENESIPKQTPHPPASGTSPAGAAAKHPTQTRSAKELSGGATTAAAEAPSAKQVDSKTLAAAAVNVDAQGADPKSKASKKAGAEEKPSPVMKSRAEGADPGRKENESKSAASHGKTDVNEKKDAVVEKNQADLRSKGKEAVTATSNKLAEPPSATASSAQATKIKKDQSSETAADNESAASNKTRKTNHSTGTTGERNVVETVSKSSIPPASEKRDHNMAVWSARPQSPLIRDEFDAIGSDAEAVLNRLIYTDDGQTVMWGSGSNGELAQGAPLYMPCPRSGYSPYKIGSVACGSEHTAFLSYDGHVACAGCGGYGQLGIGDPRALNQYVKTNPISPIMKEVSLPEETVQVCCGPTFTAALNLRGDVYMWGNNVNLQCTESISKSSEGDQATNEIALVSPRRVSIPNEQMVEIACGSGFVVARTLSGNVYTWGVDCCLGVGSYEQLESAAQKCNQRVVLVQNDRFATTGPVLVEALRGKQVKMIAAGAWHTLAILENGDLYSWGIGKYGRLGNQCDDDQLIPQIVEHFRGEKVVYAACGSFHSAVVLQNGQVFSFGNNSGGQCGELSEAPVYTPFHLFTPVPANAVFCGRFCTLVNAGRGDLYTFGSGVCTGLGFKYAPLRVYARPTMSCFINFGTSIGTSHCMSRCIGRVMAISVIGDPHPGAVVKVTHVDLHDGLVAAGLGRGFSIFVSRRGIVYAFGYNGWGQLGIGNKTLKMRTTDDTVPVADEPVRVDAFSFTRIAQVSAGTVHAGAVCEGHRVFVWGSNQFCELGLALDPSVTNSVGEPFEVPYLANKGIVNLAFGTGMSAALSTTGFVYTWGSLANCGHGKDPDEETVPSRLIQTSCDLMKLFQPCLGQPVRLASIDGIIQIAAGSYHTLALRFSGEVYAWGAGAHGSLGVGDDAQHAYEPTRVELDSDLRIVSIGCGPTNSYAITDTGDLYVWGSNSHDQCGVPGVPLVTLPRHVLSNVRSFSFAKQHSIGILYDGSIKFSGQVKVGDTVELSARSFDENVVPELTKSSLGRGQIPCQTFSGSDHSIILLERFSPHPDTMKRCFDKLQRRPERKIVAANAKRANENRAE